MKAKLSIHKSQKTAILYGLHTSLGQDCLTQLIRHKAYSSIIVLTKSTFKNTHKKVIPMTLNMTNLEDLQDDIVANDLFIFQDSHFDSEVTSTELFIEDNYLLPLRIAIYGRKNELNQVHLVTGSSTILKSVFMPHKAKEELEQSIRSLKFWACYIYKPLNVLAEEKNIRETVSSFLMNKINSAADGLLNKYVPIDPTSLVQLMIQNAQQLEKGVHVLKNEDICIIQNELNQNID